jgi:hypothetical protein
VWSIGVVVDSKVFGQHLGFEQGLEGFGVEQLVAQLAVEDWMKGYSQGCPGSI